VRGILIGRRARLYQDAIHCFSCSEHYDAIDLARLIMGGSTGDAIRWLAVRNGVLQEGGQIESRFTQIQYTNAQLFRVGFCWAIVNELAELKRPLSESGLLHSDQIFRSSSLFAQATWWSPRQTTIFYTKLRVRDPQRVRRWIREALELQLVLATAIGYAGNTETARAL
jgi:hypothetical protein